jgi:hypothetical protein
MIAVSSWQEGLSSYSNVSYDCTYAGKYLPYATCPENRDNILPRDVFNHVPYTWHYKREVHQIILDRRQEFRCYIVSWMVCYPAFLRGSREKNIYFVDRDRDDSNIDMDFRCTCCEDRHNLRWCVCYHTVTWLFECLHPPPFFSNHTL